MTNPVPGAAVDRELLRCGIRDKYTDVAVQPEKGFHFHTGRPLAAMLGYPPAAFASLPESTVASFAGTGNPFSMGEIRPGETVLDLGCGAGFDLLQAALMVGPGGRAIGVDMTPAMCEKARAGAAAMGLANVEVREGFLEALPVEDASVDVVIGNGVVNLTPDKVAAMREVARVLRPGGRFQIGDIVVHHAVPQDVRAGALLYAEWDQVLKETGFRDIRWGREVDVFSGSKHESDAADFETRGVTLSGIKP